MFARLGWLFLACGLLGMSGCLLNRPNWDQPGSVPFQQSRANYHDPYSDDDAGPKVEGGRPRDFAKPRSEPVRSRAFRDSFGSF